MHVVKDFCKTSGFEPFLLLVSGSIENVPSIHRPGRVKTGGLPFPSRRHLRHVATIPTTGGAKVKRLRVTARTAGGHDVASPLPVVAAAPYSQSINAFRGLETWANTSMHAIRLLSPSSGRQSRQAFPDLCVPGSHFLPRLASLHPRNRKCSG